MKKSILILVLLTIAAAGAFAQGFSIGLGGGGLFDWSLNNGISFNDEGNKYFIGEQVMAPGGFIFFDATYAELEVNFTYGLRTFISNEEGPVERFSNGNFMSLGFSLLGKFPFHLGRIVLFPLLGGSYNQVLTDKDKDGDSISDFNTPEGPTFTSFDWSQFGALAGAGLDINLTDSVFLRAEALFHFRFPSKMWRELADTEFAEFKPGATFGMGPKVKVGLGYKFF